MAQRSEKAGTRTLLSVFLVIATLASAMLVVKHFGGGLPGCGPRSACDDLAASVWGRVPGLGWPIVFLGLAWFGALLTAWVTARGPVPAAVRLLAILGGAFSLLYLGVMVSLGKICVYCLTAHLANLAFVIGLLMSTGRGSRMRAVSPGRWLGTGFGVFAIVIIALVAADAGQGKQRAGQAEAERTQSVNEILERNQTEASLEDLWPGGGFTGRYRFGPEKAAIRVVMFTDYQCPDCHRIESEMEPILHSRDDISLSIMHFPFCRTAEGGLVCNKYAPRDLHPFACRAARAAEAAGLVGGNDAFWKMHFWLFSKKADFTPAEFDQAISEFGLDRPAFLAAMEGDETLATVQADVERAYALGLHYTPMIFINGVELKGWNASKALERTIAQVVAAAPEPRTARDDHPVLATEKYVEDWVEQRVQRLPADARAIAYGPAAGAAVQIVVWGDYQESNTVDLDREIRAVVSEKSSIRYVFRQFPVNRECNTTLPDRLPPESVHENACWASRLVEAAGYLGKGETYLRAHEWVMAHQTEVTNSDLGAAAKALGLKEGDLLEEMKSTRVFELIDDDCRNGGKMGVKSIPLVYVNGKFVPRAARRGTNVISPILERALKLAEQEPGSGAQ